MIPLPLELPPILDALYPHNITPIVVGGYVRDALLEIQSKDIDIELYNLPSLEILEQVLKPFGKLNLVGKSFGVIKLRLKELEIDFSPPRTESKHTSGHKGFAVCYNTPLDFPTAARRRDFTINAIGYNPKTKTLLDPYGGCDDLSAKRLMCVDEETFIEDPLRPLRAVQFVGRFHLRCNPKLLALCKKMIASGALKELPKERIFEELKKLLLLSTKPSIGLNLLKEMGGEFLFEPLSPSTWDRALVRVDELSQNTPKSLPLLFAALLLETKNPEKILKNITNERALLRMTKILIEHAHAFGSLVTPPLSLLQGRDLIALGLSPSPRFKTILERVYVAQLHQEFSTKDEAKIWLKNHLVTVT